MEASRSAASCAYKADLVQPDGSSMVACFACSVYGRQNSSSSTSFWLKKQILAGRPFVEGCILGDKKSSSAAVQDFTHKVNLVRQTTNHSLKVALRSSRLSFDEGCICCILGTYRRYNDSSANVVHKANRIFTESCIIYRKQNGNRTDFANRADLVQSTG